MINVVFVRWGDKYSDVYSLRLKKMVENNLTLACKFYLITDNATEAEQEQFFIINPPYYGLDGWWAKMYLYMPHLVHW